MATCTLTKTVLAAVCPLALGAHDVFLHSAQAASPLPPLPPVRSNDSGPKIGSIKKARVAQRLANLTGPAAVSAQFFASVNKSWISSPVPALATFIATRQRLSIPLSLACPRCGIAAVDDGAHVLACG